ncbi:MAG: hypothetical protein PHU53_04685 [Thermoplasmata archaeon]|nr:hypothetical protein [Thermoplasmata archaeon]
MKPIFAGWRRKRNGGRSVCAPQRNSAISELFIQAIRVRSAAF